MTERVSVRSLSAADATSFASFSCASWNEPWTVIIEELIREPTKLAYSLQAAELRGVGAWLAEDDRDALAGIAAWKFVPADLPDSMFAEPAVVCWSALLAVDRAYRRRGLGLLLKQHVVDAAISEGAVAVVSDVHWDNEAMLRLNWRFGADHRRQPGDDDYALSVIPLPVRQDWVSGR